MRAEDSKRSGWPTTFTQASSRDVEALGHGSLGRTAPAHQAGKVNHATAGRPLEPFTMTGAWQG